MFIRSKRRCRKPDPLFLLLAFVALGMCVTLSYQVAIYSDASENPLATQAPGPTAVGG